jgi:hypothetical protein
MSAQAALDVVDDIEVMAPGATHVFPRMERRLVEVRQSIQLEAPLSTDTINDSAPVELTELRIGATFQCKLAMRGEEEDAARLQDPRELFQASLLGPLIQVREEETL